MKLKDKHFIFTVWLVNVSFENVLFTSSIKAALLLLSFQVIDLSSSVAGVNMNF